MNSFKLRWLYGVAIVCSLSFALFQSLPFYRTAPSPTVSNLHELGLYLRQKDLDLRGIPSRDDGLWVDAVYLTVTDRETAEIRALPIDPTRVGKWKGTVIVFSKQTFSSHDTSDWGENGLYWGPFVFFGDKEILRKIVEALED